MTTEMKIKHIVFAAFLAIYIAETRQFESEEELENFLKNRYETAASSMCTKQAFAEWDFATDVANKEKEEAQLNATLEAAAFDKEYWETYFRDLNPDDYKKESIRRQVKNLVILGNAALNQEQLTEFTNIGNTMTNIYSTAKICPYTKQNCDREKEGLYLTPEIEAIMATSTNYKELEYVWASWRDASGANIKKHYGRYVELSNKIAEANGFEDRGKMWINSYESPTFIEDMDKLWQQVEPLYNELHKYVRNKLKTRYGNEIDLSDGLIPAHVLGNMWGQSWVNIYSLVVPYPEASEMDITAALKEQGYNALKMFETSDEFYKSLGLEPNEICYNVAKGAMIEKPVDREVLCHASAWDFCDGENYRVKMCTEVDYEDFITIHHEMGHIQYYLLYKNQPISLRSGANPGFHEAIGDTIALSVATPTHLKKLGLLEKYEDTDEASLNALMSMALERVAFLPFGLIIDKWRWDVFSGEVSPEKWNSHWWYYRNIIQKVKSPVLRSDENDFDPGAKFHVAGDSQYINYFVAHILEFQLYRGLCVTAGEYNPDDPNSHLNKCDFHDSKLVGNKLREGLSLGASKHWKDALEVMTGERDLDASAILDYFKPLYLFLQKENAKLTEDELNNLLINEYEPAASSIENELVIAQWNFATDVNNEQKQKEQLEATLKAAEFTKRYWDNYFHNLNEDDYKDQALKRQVNFLKVLGNSALDTEKLTELTNIGNEMTNIYSTGKICPYKKQDCILETEGLSLEPDIESILVTSTDYDELSYVWKAWRDASGAKVKNLYPTYVDLSNEAATINGFNDKGDMWRNDYESPNFIDDLDKIWKQVEPLYMQLHKFVGRKLKNLYGEKLNIEDGLIPAHIFGNMWAQSWNNLSPLVKPFPNASTIDVTAALKEQGYTVLKMFQTSDEFYQSLGLAPNDMSYNETLGAVIVKPEDREILCHASAWDFSDKKDFRIKMCTEIDYEYFIVIHHEMGHIQYFIQYKDQPISFRDGANPGFHEAVGDTIALSVATPKHLEKIGLLKDYQDSEEATINTLMDMALERVAFLPFGLLIDKWRWDVFAEKIPKEKWNSHWWKYRDAYQKVKAPVSRDDSKDFDPGAKYHVPGDSQYINYFVAHILEFQLYRALCIEAGQYDPNNDKLPLHKCDFYQSKEAGAKLKAGLSIGSSKHWKDSLEAMTGERDLDASAILDYFKPLYLFLQKENAKLTEDELNNLLKNEYEPAASSIENELVIAQWNFATDVNNEQKQQEQLEATLKAAKFTKRYWDNYFHNLNEDDYTDQALKRQVNFLKVLGNSALDTEKLTELTNIGNEMTNIYSTGKICPYKKQDCILETEGLSLEPDIESILVTSTDYDELSYVWQAWRDASGAKVKNLYPTYVDLSNEAATINGFNDKGDMWRNDYESPNFIDDLDKIWKQVEPLYTQLHKYVGRKLKNLYGEKLNIEDGLIPAHIFGNMWAQSWINLSPLVKPFPNASTIDVTAALKEQGYTVLKMFQTSDEFYQSLGLAPNDMSYNETLGAVIVKPEDREILCHASAWDFSDKKDFRIKMCTEIDYEYFIVIHHEMGHIQYFIQYKDQPISFRDGANPGFHEAVGDTIALSVATPKHLEKIGLLKDYQDSEEATINTLMDMALERVAFLPFGLLIDKWRWDVFAEKIPKEEWNSHWWKYREAYQKVKAPVSRDDSKDFDPGAKYHVPGDSQYINYFVAHILEFQLYRALCIEAGQYDPNNDKLPLHKCDFYQSKEAGAKLKAGLSIGSSKHWKDSLEAMTGERELSATAILEYFSPLLEYLREQNKMDEEELTVFLKDYDIKASEMENQLVIAEWNYATDINNSSKEIEKLEAVSRTAEFDKSNWNEHFKYLKEEDFENEALQRHVGFLKILGNAALDSDKLEELTIAGNEMTKIYSTAKICPCNKPKCNLEEEGLELEPDIQNILANSNDYDELVCVWKAWRDATGAKMKTTYEKYVTLSNDAAKANDFRDKGDMWRNDYESETFVEDMNRIWEKVKPLYNELHRYVAKKLKKVYQDKLDIEDGLIPAHVLGNMWAQSWINLASVVKPYPEASSINVTKALQDQDYTVLKMFETADAFYTNLGLHSNSMSYNVAGGAIIIKPNDREILCHASAWDFSDKKDFRIKMCTEVNYEDFITVHHEMGHIQYFINYKEQPISFRDGANPGFHEAVGDTIALSVATPKHLKKIELLPEDYNDTNESAINSLMDMALERVAFLPFGLLIDKWRWDVFSGAVVSDEWNSHWWNYRKTIQKVKAPVERSDLTDFDPGAKYHVPGDSQYINYFVAHILEFQLYRALCIAAEQYDPKNSELPLHKCDYDGSKKAGTILRNGLELGASKHWKDVLREMTGETDLDPSAILEYFEPLFQYLKQENGPFNIEAEFKTFLQTDYEPSASMIQNDQVTAEWNFATDVSNPSKQQEQVDATLRSAEFTSFYYNNYFKELVEEDYKEMDTQRQLKFLRLIGNAALDTEKLTEFTQIGLEMTNIYSTAKICPYNKLDCDLANEGLTLEPGIEEIMSNSIDYQELQYAWTAWRDESGAKIKDKYPKYVELSNEAATENGFTDKGDMWRSEYESDTFIEDIDKLWEEVKPLYNELHQYVAGKLKERYGNELDISDGLIPAHILGNMWGQSWVNLFPLVKPYPLASEVDVTAALLEQNYTVLKMFETSNDFYTSLGLESNHMSYDVKLGAVIEKPSDREILCHASAWDFSNGKDFRIKMCTNVNYEDFITVHHEMGHIEYFILYKNQPVAFRTGANPGFHEAVGDTIALSVATPQHLQKIKLLTDYEDSDEAAINALMDMALERVAFLPFGLLIDKWRWDVFSGTVPKEKWNSHWWDYRKTYQKVKPPVDRSDETDFDPGAKYHVPGDSQYINYFVARILQFQLYRGLCKVAGQYDPENKDVPLHKCDFYQSKQAGAKLRDGLSLGASKHWKDALKEITGETDLDASALLEYFEPLMKYLKEQNNPDGGPQDDVSQLVPIVVGSILGVFLVASISIYCYKRNKH